MTTARIVKLATGDFLTLMVEGASEVEGQYGKQLRLDGQTAENENVTLFLPLESATRQLERISLTAAAAVGAVLKVAKVEKNGRTFINIDHAAGSPTNGKGKVAATQRAEPEWLADQQADEENFVAKTTAPNTPNVDRWFAHYDKCFAHACELARRTKNPETVVTLEGISAIAATLYIATKSAI